MITTESRSKILAVDDRPDNLYALRRLLSRLDVDLIEASSGNEALMHTLNHDFALVLMDVQMPEMDGFETADLMRQAEATRDLPVVFVTANHQTMQDQIKGYESGAVDYILKPVNEAILLSKVAVFVASYERRQEIERQKEKLEAEICLRMEIEEELREIRSELEVMVEERTAELRTSNHELVRQVKEAVRASAKLGLFRELIDQSNDAILIVEGEAGSVIDCNQTLGACTGYESTELKKLELRDLLSSLNPSKAWPSLLERMEDEGTVFDKSDLLCKDGQVIPVEWSVKRIRRGPRQYLIVAIHNLVQRPSVPARGASAREQFAVVAESLGGSHRFLGNTLERLGAYVAACELMLAAARESDSPICESIMAEVEVHNVDAGTVAELERLIRDAQAKLDTLIEVAEEAPQK
jgi:PAS domain S-box-containing protein